MWPSYTHPISMLPADLRQILMLHSFLPPMEKLPVWQSRLLMNQLDTFFGGPAPKNIDQKAITFKCPAADTTCFSPQVTNIKRAKLFSPHQPKKRCMLFLHGGGWVLGSSWSHRRFCQQLAAHCQCHVLSLDYRRSPEHPFPAALHDSIDAWDWLVQHPLLGKKAGNTLAIGGDSAGGQLTALVSSKVREKPNFQLLIYPVTEQPSDSPSMSLYKNDYLLTRSLFEWFWSQYIPSPAPNAASPDQTPDSQVFDLKEIRAGFPPTLLALCEHDILFDQGLRFERHLQSCGVPVDLKIYPRMIHGFINLMGLKSSRSSALDLILRVDKMFSLTDFSILAEKNAETTPSGFP